MSTVQSSKKSKPFITTSGNVLMEVQRVAFACEDKFIREDEYALLVKDETDRQNAASAAEYQTQVNDALNSMSICDASSSSSSSSSNTADAFRARLTQRRQLEEFATCLYAFVEKQVQFAEEVSVLQLARDCVTLHESNVSNATRSQLKCVFTRTNCDELHEIRFDCLDALGVSITRSPAFIVSRNHMGLIRAVYVVTHAMLYITRAVELSKQANTEEQKQNIQLLHQEIQNAVNHGARLMFNFYQFRHTGNANIKTDTEGVKPSESICICKNFVTA